MINLKARLRLNMSFVIFNQPVGDMCEIPNEWADFVITSPPYNIGHGPSDVQDLLPFNEYCNEIVDVLHSSIRVVGFNGFIIIDVAKWVVTPDLRKIYLKELVEDFLAEHKIKKIQCIRYKSQLLSGKQNIIDWQTKHGHSADQIILVYTKSKQICRMFKGIKDEYEFAQGENEVCWPSELVKDIFDCFKLKGSKVVDPFAGTAKLGVKIACSGGHFIGYEKSAIFTQIALSNAIENGLLLHQCFQPSN